MIRFKYEGWLIGSGFEHFEEVDYCYEAEYTAEAIVHTAQRAKVYGFRVGGTADKSEHGNALVDAISAHDWYVDDPREFKPFMWSDAHGNVMTVALVTADDVPVAWIVSADGLTEPLRVVSQHHADQIVNALTINGYTNAKRVAVFS